MIIGEVELREMSGVWMDAILRADDGPVIVGTGASVLEHSLVEAAKREVDIGERAVVNHCAIVHGAKIYDWALVGIGAIVLEDAHVGEGAVVGAGALVTSGVEIPPYKLALGIPATVRRDLTGDEIEFFGGVCRGFSEKAKIYKRLRQRGCEG